jgi:hypothetical protein
VRAASALAAVLAAAAAPLVMWGAMLGDVLASFHWSLRYVAAELSPWLLLLVGVLFLLPVAASAGRDPESRLYPRDRRTYFAWGTSLYVLGAVLAVQVSEIWAYAH